MKLVRLPERPADWDARVAACDTKTLFHETAWHAHLLDIHPTSRMEYWAVEDGGAGLGYVSAQRVRKAIFDIGGTPMPGTGTNFMGPAVAAGTDQRALLAALLAAFRVGRYDHVEMAHPWLDPAVMESLGFRAQTRMTHIVPLPPTEQAAWDALTSPCRNRVRKAQKQGVTAEVTDDPAIADRYYEQFVEVYGKQGMVAPFGSDRPRSLVARLGPAGRLVAIWVKHEGEVIATGLFPCDERCVYFWGGASWLRYQHLCPNELLHWTLIQHAIRRGIPRYDMCGGTSQFKDKFGGADEPHRLYNASFTPLIALGRRAYTWWHFGRLRLKGLLKPRAKRPPRPAAEEAP
jgi:hypothetical protein